VPSQKETSREQKGEESESKWSITFTQTVVFQDEGKGGEEK